MCVYIYIPSSPSPVVLECCILCIDTTHNYFIRAISSYIYIAICMLSSEIFHPSYLIFSSYIAYIYIYIYIYQSYLIFLPYFIGRDFFFYFYFIFYL